MLTAGDVLSLITLYRHRRRQVLSRPSRRKCGRRRVRGHGDRGEEDKETEEGREGHDL